MTGITAIAKMDQHGVQTVDSRFAVRFPANIRGHVQCFGILYILGNFTHIATHHIKGESLEMDTEHRREFMNRHLFASIHLLFTSITIRSAPSFASCCPYLRITAILGIRIIPTNHIHLDEVFESSLHRVGLLQIHTEIQKVIECVGFRIAAMTA